MKLISDLFALTESIVIHPSSKPAVSSLGVGLTRFMELENKKKQSSTQQMCIEFLYFSVIFASFFFTIEIV